MRKADPMPYAIRTAGPGDLPALARLDRHISPAELETLSLINI